MRARTRLLEVVEVDFLGGNGLHRQNRDDDYVIDVAGAQIEVEGFVTSLSKRVVVAHTDLEPEARQAACDNPRWPELE